MTRLVPLLFSWAMPYRDGVPFASNALEAAAWHKSVRITCVYGHSVVLNGDGLWWLCERRGWAMDFVSLRARFYCRHCWQTDCRKVRPRRIEACDDQPSVFLPHPPESEARKAAKRFR